MFLILNFGFIHYRFSALKLLIIIPDKKPETQLFARSTAGVDQCLNFNYELTKRSEGRKNTFPWYGEGIELSTKTLDAGVYLLRSTIGNISEVQG